ncbi:phospholipase blike protein g, putative [Acanthamoeba castellanii str. Neff]|uniref:Phospholipase B-like n=2 Tax=Acanthamoeba castellanii (strain ATCC 30010 / Neff) TaxID=1257118 RepID=L8GDQ4_ACACF|nr:phospholipase blike protein g, putative [Acanthamoeba castellanii str. Neff]ELR11152.1 phospholipase blike protein g, putative [Acanthamoeba castellanii str. Neff]
MAVGSSMWPRPERCGVLVCTIVMAFIFVGIAAGRCTCIQGLPRSKRTDASPATGYFVPGLNKTGWDVLHVVGSPNYTPDQQMFAAGYVEGFLTAKQISDWYTNYDANQFHTKPVSDGLRNYLTQQLSWARAMSEKMKHTSDYWMHVSLILQQFDGLVAGYQASLLPHRNLSSFDLYLLNSAGDIEDLANLYPQPGMRRSFKPEAPLEFTDCSALITLLPKSADLFAGHTTWTDYYSMNRIYKHYSLPLTGAAAVNISFSSRPGMLSSKDDWYTMSSGLVSLETTNAVYNKSLYANVKPEGSLLCWQRAMLANRLAKTGKEWTDIFAQHNSGTYNNQWMVVNYNLFQAGRPLKAGTLHILEQIPGYTMSDDVTHVLASQGYWPSYNVPYFEWIYNISGWTEMLAKYGDNYSYAKCPRATIFRRPTYNDWQHDPLALNDPANGISSRYDLRGDIDKPAFAFGGIDSKATSSAMMINPERNMLALAISGPTHQQQTPFEWTAKWEDVHEGQPALWNFDWVVHDSNANRS